MNGSEARDGPDGRANAMEQKTVDEPFSALGKRGADVKKHLRNDILLIGGLAAAGLALCLLLYLNRDTGMRALVRVDGELTAVFPLSQEVSYTIESKNGGTNELRIADGSVWLESANCPDALCVLQGKIRHAGESIICLPHGVVVELIGEDELGMDAVTQ